MKSKSSESVEQGSNEQLFQNSSTDDYLELYEIFTFLRKWWRVVLLFVAMGAGVGALCALRTHSYYESTLLLRMDRPLTQVGSATSQIRGSLRDLFEHRDLSEAFASQFLLSLRDDRAGASQPGTAGQADAVYNAIVRELSSLTGAESSEASHELAQRQLTYYLTTTMTAYLSDEALIPARGFLFFLTADENSYRLQLRSLEKGVATAVASATARAFTKAAEQYNRELPDELKKKKQQELASLGELEDKLTQAQVDLAAEAKEHLTAKLEMSRIASKLTSLLGPSQGGPSQITDELARSFLSTRPLAFKNTGFLQVFKNFAEFMDEQRMIHQLGSAVERKLMNNQQSEELISNWITHRIKANASDHEQDKFFNAYYRIMTEHKSIRRSMSERYAARGQTVGNAAFSQDALDEAMMVGALDVKKSLGMTFPVAGGALGFILACLFAAFYHSRERWRVSAPSKSVISA